MKSDQDLTNQLVKATEARERIEQRHREWMSAVDARIAAIIRLIKTAREKRPKPPPPPRRRRRPF